ncbi:hypothetical protein BT96DRAFT_912930 [Gymnopus androsaceus JB14]|uniref:Hyaluronan/mRNA-binding protein domain-containing protein n=1 Tax=Gymnopus androsaceus JB14 TaxID=1447944 RepID=A0A6A4ILX4_9AGAR|nr:hypothetical protein BT96DRAFT_912930 [Gymnopus androsaceus JB14]
MTRTARAAFPRAIVKDRQSRSGLKNDMKKQGAGTHNWGKLGDITDASELEYGEYDSEGELTEISSSIGSDASLPAPRKRSSSVPSEKEIEVAKQLRKNALNGGADLATIARTSVALSSSPPKTIPVTSDANTSI